MIEIKENNYEHLFLQKLELIPRRLSSKSRVINFSYNVNSKKERWHASGWSVCLVIMKSKDL
jgi:hypothetical protein